MHRYDRDYIDSQNRLSDRQSRLDECFSDYLKTTEIEVKSSSVESDHFQNRRNAYYELMTSYGMTLVEAQQQVQHNIDTGKPLWYKGW